MKFSSEAQYNAYDTDDINPLLYFWVLGDLHYRAIPAWNAVHAERLAPMFEDLHDLWRAEGAPAFCASPGDIIETCALENYKLAKADLEFHLGSVPFYPGLGNHEFYGVDGEDPEQMLAVYSSIWHKPVRYAWTEGKVTCIMLEYPDPHKPKKVKGDERVIFSREALAFLDETLAEHPDDPAVIFAHCPLRDTVLDRDPERHLDYNSRQTFFSTENSQEVRDILARHSNACLYFSGHTHSGWKAPNLVCTEQPGGHPVTFVNIMSPWYTGCNHGPRMSADQKVVNYYADDPDILATFAVQLYPHQALIRLRDHRARRWLEEWTVPIG